jgi:hypothetical protein
MFGDPHTGVALAALRKLVRRKMIRPQAARRGDLDRARAQVRGAEDGVPSRAAPGRHVAFPQEALEIGRRSTVTDAIKRFADKVKLLGR